MHFEKNQTRLDYRNSFENLILIILLGNPYMLPISAKKYCINASKMLLFIIVLRSEKHTRNFKSLG